jgi:serpin B
MAMPLAAIVAALLTALPAASAHDGIRGDVQALARAYNGSGQMLFRQLSAGRGNIVFSPYSVGTAMAMALAGARGDTEREMAAVLQHALGRARMGDANAAALAVLNGYDKSGVPPTCPPTMQLAAQRCEAPLPPEGHCMFLARRTGALCTATPRFPPSAKLLAANALMMGNAGVAKDYEALLRNRYGAEVFRGVSIDTVNGWVKERTEGRIPQIMDQMSDLVLVNAVYFKARWAVTFDKKLTKPEFFSLSRSRQELVPSMLQRASHSVVARDGYRAIRLPYAVRQLAMVIALPDEVDGIGALAQRIDSDELAALLGKLRGEPPRRVILTLPRFRAEHAIDLKEQFQAAGMRLAFDLRKADFSAMTGVPPAAAPAAIDQIVHRAAIEVAEESTEAAAATAVGIQIASAQSPPAEPMQFRVDRPFLYYIVDNTTGAVLFQGRVVDPR